MNKEQISKEIREFLYEDHLSEEFENLTDDDSLLETGIIDSVKMLDLIEFIEKTFTFTVDEDDMVPENFDTINSLTEYISGNI